MQNRHWFVAVIAALAMLSVSASAVGQAAEGKGPDDALTLPSGWQTLEPGQQVWYAFRYQGDKSEILIKLSASPAASAAFAVWSPTDADRWRRGDAVEPTGRGSANDHFGGSLIWAGSSGYAGVWYIVVEPAAQTGFTLEVSGSGISRELVTAVPASPAAARTASIPTAGPRPVTSTPAPSVRPVYNPPTVLPAQHPAAALALPETPQTLGAGQHIWYAFQYVGDRSQILIQLHADPPGSATFTVWSPDVLQRWGEGYFYAPTGRGTASDVYDGDLIWSGGSIIKGTWYVVVEQAGKSASTYALRANGTGIDRILPPTPTPTPTYSLPIPKFGWSQ